MRDGLVKPGAAGSFPRWANRRATLYRRFVWLIRAIPYDWWEKIRDRVAGGLIDEMVEAPDEWQTTWIAAPSPDPEIEREARVAP